MSDVNEFNVETGEFVLRPYTEEEIQLFNDLQNIDISDIPKSIPVPLSIEQQEFIDRLISLGFTEEDAKKIIGVNNGN